MFTENSTSLYFLITFIYILYICIYQYTHFTVTILYICTASLLVRPRRTTMRKRNVFFLCICSLNVQKYATELMSLLFSHMLQQQNIFCPIFRCVLRHACIYWYYFVGLMMLMKPHLHYEYFGNKRSSLEWLAVSRS